MSGIREVIDSTYIPLDIHQRRVIFDVTIPENYLVNEPHHERIVQIWYNNIQPAITDLLRTRRSRFINTYTKRAVFKSGMENICTDFSRRTETIKLEFHVNNIWINKHKNKRKELYTLIITKLDSIPENLRNIRYCIAEIPSQYQETDAVLIGTTTEAQQDDDSNNNNIVSVPYEMIDDNEHAPCYIPYTNDILSNAQQYISPPLVTEVIEIELKKSCI